MTQPRDDEATAQFAAIERKFVEGLPRRLQEIDAAPDAQARYAALHRLAGAAGAFGHAQLGELARQAMGTDAAADVALQVLREEVSRLARARPA